MRMLASRPRLTTSATGFVSMDRLRRQKVQFTCRRLRRFAFFVALGISSWNVQSSARANPFVQLDYELTLSNRSRDTVFIELFDDRPLTCDNFLQYVDAGLYDGSLMHRLSRNFVVQGGGFYPVLQSEPPPVNTSLDPAATVDLDGNPITPNPTVVNEFANVPLRSNVRGTIAMAKIGGQPNSATNQWFVNLANNAASLDNQNGGFTVFGEVRGDGMIMMDAINTLSIVNLNPDANNDGIRDAGPFGLNANDGVPFLGNQLVVLENARRVDYFGASGSSTMLNVPAGGFTISARCILRYRNNFHGNRWIDDRRRPHVGSPRGHDSFAQRQQFGHASAWNAKRRDHGSVFRSRCEWDPGDRNPRNDGRHAL